MKVFQSKHNLIGGSDFKEVNVKLGTATKLFGVKQKEARTFVRLILKKIKSFWNFFGNTWSKDNPNNAKEILHRFAGKSKDKQSFYVQIKENKQNDEKYFMSVFPL